MLYNEMNVLLFVLRRARCGLFTVNALYLITVRKIMFRDLSGTFNLTYSLRAYPCLPYTASLHQIELKFLLAQI